MGHPGRQRRKYSTPKHMFRGREGEMDMVRAYGLKNAKELWKVKSEVSRIRGLARKLLANPNEKESKDLMASLVKKGLITKESKLEDVLKLTVENLLDRRLQTVAYKRGLVISIKQARQDIVHGHIAVAGKRITAPGHTLTLEEAEKVDFYPGSKIANPEHPIRKVEKKASTEKVGSREVKAEEVKPLAGAPEDEAIEVAIEEVIDDETIA